ncbi:MAG: c-type cytochrome [Bryobacteraceae bacterium]
MRLVPLTLLLAAACLAQTKNPHTTAEDAASGARIFRSHCADCHGLTGQGGKGPDLTTGQFFHGESDAALFENVSDGIPGTAMPGVFFSSDQVWQIISFVRTLAKKGSAKAPNGNAANGAQVYRANGCANCHLVRGQGGVNGPDLSFIGSQRPADQIRKSILEPNAHVDQAYWQADITLENGAPYKGFLMNEDTYNVQMLHPAKGLLTLPKRDFRKFEISKTSAMPSFQGKLQDAELQDLVAYLWSLQRPRRTE